MKALFRAAAVSALIVAGSAGAAAAQTAPTPVAADSVFRATTLNLAAFGEVSRAPDKATITLGVTTDGATAAEAVRLNADRMSQVIAALKKAGVADKDIRTSNLNINPQYIYQENLPPRLSGYKASNQVTVTVLDLKKLGGIVDATVNSGATDVGGIVFGLQNSEEAENAARLEAVKALQAKADLYGKATGHRVYRLVTLSEGAGYSPPPMPVMVANYARMEKAADGGTPVAAGELQIRVDVSATYELVK